MLRSIKEYKIQDVKAFKTRLLYWSQQFEEVMWLDSNQHSDTYSNYDAILAVDAFTLIKTDDQDGFEKLKEYQEQTSDWIFGYLAYDLKNDVENLHSGNYDGLKFPDLYFFQPKKIFLLKGDCLQIAYLPLVDDEIEDDFEQILTFSDKISYSDLDNSPCGRVKILSLIHI